MQDTFTQLRQRYPDLEQAFDSIQAAYDILYQTFTSNHKLLICGNGGSAADSDHIVGELMKDFESKRPIDDELAQKLKAVSPETGDYLARQLQGGLPTISLNANMPLITAISNDMGADMIYAQQVYGYGQAGDTLLAISTSGNSANVLHAVHVANAIGMNTIGLTGQDGGKLRRHCSVTMCVPRTRTLEVQELHLPIYHALCIALENDIFKSS